MLLGGSLVPFKFRLNADAQAAFGQAVLLHNFADLGGRLCGNFNRHTGSHCKSTGAEQAEQNEMEGPVLPAPAYNPNQAVASSLFGSPFFVWKSLTAALIASSANTEQ